jgi:general secretion pathway protein G
MKTSTRWKRGGFTLVEMLAVIAIIVILAALVVQGLKFAKEKERLNKAKVQIALLAKAIEEYKLDNGAYPPSSSATGENSTADLRKVLYLDGKNDSSVKIYLSDLDVTSTQGWVSEDSETAEILDPWGNEYFYRTGTGSINPDFDLWSSGKDSQTNADDPKADVSLDDVRN